MRLWEGSVEGGGRGEEEEGEGGWFWTQRAEEEGRLHGVPPSHYKPETAEAALGEWGMGAAVWQKRRRESEGERRGGGGFWAQRSRGAEEEEERLNEVLSSHYKPETAEAALGEWEPGLKPRGGRGGGETRRRRRFLGPEGAGC